MKAKVYIKLHDGRAIEFELDYRPDWFAWDGFYCDKGNIKLEHIKEVTIKLLA